MMSSNLIVCDDLVWSNAAVVRLRFAARRRLAEIVGPCFSCRASIFISIPHLWQCSGS